MCLIYRLYRPVLFAGLVSAIVVISLMRLPASRKLITFVGGISLVGVAVVFTSIVRERPYFQAPTYSASGVPIASVFEGLRVSDQQRIFFRSVVLT